MDTASTPRFRKGVLARLTDAEAKAEALRDEGEQRLREAVIGGEQEAVRAVEDHALDRVGREVARGGERLPTAGPAPHQRADAEGAAAAPAHRR